MGGLTSAQLCSLACQTAGTPGWTPQAGQILNSILSDLCQTYELDVCRGTFNVNFNAGIVESAVYPNVVAGAGPFALPSDWLRAIRDDVMWFNQGVPYPMIPVDLAEFDWYVQQAGNQAYPYLFATDVSQNPPVFVVWPGASGAYPVMARYRRQMPDIGSGIAPTNGAWWNPGTATPDTSTVVPWFPNQQYLLTRLSGELMRLADDPRYEKYLGDGPSGAVGILRRVLTLINDDSNRAQRVTLDRRRFGRPFNRLPNTKKVGF